MNKQYVALTEMMVLLKQSFGIIAFPLTTSSFCVQLTTAGVFELEYSIFTTETEPGSFIPRKSILPSSLQTV